MSLLLVFGRSRRSVRPLASAEQPLAAYDDEELIHVMEVWDSKDHHAASLQLPQTRAAIAKAMPMLTGEFSSVELRVLGGLGAT